MKEITIREAQLLVLAVKHHKVDSLLLDDDKFIRIGDDLYITAISLKVPFVTIKMERKDGDGLFPETDAPICLFSDEVIGKIIQTLRDCAYNEDRR